MKPSVINKITFDFEVNSAQFLSMSNKDRELLLSSLSEEEKFKSLGMFKTLPNGKVGWNQKKNQNNRN
jgi:hypothetical protein